MVRIGLDYIESIGEDDAKALVAERERDGPFRDLRDLAQRAELDRDGLTALVLAGACDCFADAAGSSATGDRSARRRALLWTLGLVPRSQSVPGTGGEARQLALPLEPTVEAPPLAEPTAWEKMLTDYRTTSLSVGVHPLALLRPHLAPDVLSSRDLAAVRHGTRVAVAGMAVARQRPATANGVVFMLLEDEFGQTNLIVPPPVYERFRAVVRGEPLLLARGRLERVDRNQNVVVSTLDTLAPLARRLADDLDVSAALPPAHHFGHR